MPEEKRKDLEALVAIVAPRLTEKELEAFRYWQNSNQPAVAPSTQVKFFQLYLNGCNCEEIRRLNPGFSLGSIVSSRIAGEWDRRMAEYTSELLDTTLARVQQVTLESAGFVSNLLATANQQYGDCLKRYMQSGNEADLGDLKISSLQAYKTAIELLQKITGQDKTQKVSGEVLLKVDPSTLSLTKPPTAEEVAVELRKLLEKKGPK